MISANVPSSVTSIGTDNQKTYEFPFRIESISDLEITITRIADGEQEVLEVDRYSTLFKFFPLLGGSVTLLPYTPGVDEFEYLDGSGNLKHEFAITVAFKANPNQPSQFTDTNNTTPKALEKRFDGLTMQIKAALAIAMSALRIPDTSEGGGGIDPVFPPLIGNENRGLYVNEDATGFKYGPTVNQIQGLVDQAEAYKNQSGSYATQSQGYANQSRDCRDESQGYANQSLTYRNQANDAAVLANGFKVQAEGARDAAIEAENSAEEWSIKSEGAANRTLYTTIVEVSNLDSPILITNADKHKLYVCDATDGDIIFRLPDMQTVDFDFKIGTLKVDASPNAVRVFSDVVDTINDGPSISSTTIDFGTVVYADLPGTNWKGRYFVRESATIDGGGGGMVIDGTVQAIIPNGKITPIDGRQSVVTVEGSAPGITTANATPIYGTPKNGDIITIRGNSSVNVVKIVNADVDEGFLLEDDFYATKDAQLMVYYDQARKRYYETSRINRL